MKVTMKDIANKLNISINAVSIALNEKPGVSDEMRLQILKTADELGYINEKKKYLSALSKSNICILMQSYYASTGHFYSIVLHSIVEEAKKYSYYSIMNYFEDDDFVLPQCIEERKVAGVIVVGKISHIHLRMLKKTGIPVVLVDFTSLYECCDCVLTHNKQGGSMITQYVIDKGYKTIGFFGDIEYSMSFQDRYLGYRYALDLACISEDIDSYVNQYSHLHKLEKFILNNQIDEIVELLKSKPLPQVFVCSNDSNAFALITALKQMGLSVPKDVGVTGFDDIPICEKSVPQITTVQVQKELMGRVALTKLIDRIHRKDGVMSTQLLNVLLVERQSV